MNFYSKQEIIYFQSSNTVNERLNIEQAFLAHYLTNLQTLNLSGHSFTPQIQKDVFNCPLVEDPSLISELFEGSLNHVEEIHKSSSKKEKAEAILKASCKVLETVTLRHRLIIATLETEVLSNIYKKQCNEMGFEDFHLFLRYIEFDIAKYKDNPGQSVPIFVNEMNSEDSQIDRYVSNALLLAAHEIDETHIGRISFRTKESIQNVRNCKVLLFEFYCEVPKNSFGPFVCKKFVNLHINIFSKFFKYIDKGKHAY